VELIRRKENGMYETGVACSICKSLNKYGNSITKFNTTEWIGGRQTDRQRQRQIDRQTNRQPDK